MSNERFPKAKYLRQLAAMRSDLLEWKVAYAQAGDRDPYGWLGGRYDARAAVLDHAAHLIAELEDTLYGLPRLQ